VADIQSRVACIVTGIQLGEVAGSLDALGVLTAGLLGGLLPSLL
jgi:hypothetical protein